MGLLNKKYYRLKPTEEYLTDEVILALAWKKSHEYIRSTNWYVNTFELDRSAINLESYLKKWINDIEAEDFKFDSLRLIPAPKSHKWHFKNRTPLSAAELIDENIFSEAWSDINDIWEPLIEDGAHLKGLRPLAHVGIRDQSLNTMLMMCLADEVETIQGNTETSLNEVHKEKIVSYGNRLYCEYHDKKAHFNWGNSTIYNKYFTDYQRFLLRPAHFGRKALETITSNEIVYEIHVDITKFFDRVNREILCEKLFEFFENYENPIAYRLINALVDWNWKRGSRDLYSSVCSEEGSKIPRGIPQGLVAGGFYANVYLLDFDQAMSLMIGKVIGESISLKLVDYCRYVDDMRFIVIADKSRSNKTSTKESVKQEIAQFLQEYLEPLGLSLNTKKTKIDEFRSSVSGISTKLKSIQSTISGPLSYKEIDEQLGHLEGLIHLAESLKPEDQRKSTNPLASIENYSLDVRDDTLLRFSANKIHSLLKSKRHMTSHEVDESGVLICT